MTELGYAAFREDYRERWNEPQAEPLFTWNHTNHAKWIRIENAARLAERERCAQIIRDAMVQYGISLDLETSTILQNRILGKT